jgi:hypothetical protein
MRVWALVCVVACSGKPDPVVKKDAGAPTADASPLIEVPARTLGLPDLAAYGWRKRGGHPAFKVARKAEAAEDWATVVTTCKQALAADPGNLEAAWLLAAGLGKLGKKDELLAPLQIAASGDFGKWGPASLELPMLQPFLATPIGEAWRRRVEADRSTYVAALGRSTIVSANGDLYATDVEGKRWYRLTRTYGVVIGALRVSPTRIVYVTRQRVANGANRKSALGIGLILLDRGKTSRPIDLGTSGPITVAWTSAPAVQGVWIGAGAPHPTSWRRLDEDFKLTAIPGKATRPPGPWIEVHGRQVQLHALPIPGVSADWDDKGFASAARIGKSSRVITVPAPGLIDGNSTTWSPDHARLAFVAQLDDQCAKPGAKPSVTSAVFVADATTGAITEIERAASGLAVEWVSDRRLAIAGDKGVALVNADGGERAAIVGADGLIPPRRLPTCMPDVPEPDAPLPDDESGEPSDVKLVEPP